MGKKWIALTLIIVFLFGILPTRMIQGGEGDYWSQRSHDCQNTRLSSNDGPTSEPMKKWALFLGEGPGLYMEPIIGNDGTLYVCGSPADSYENCLYAVSPEGKTQWQFQPADQVALGTDGTIFVFGEKAIESGGENTSEDWLHYEGWLFALNSAGTEKWSTKLDIDIQYGFQDLLIGPDSRIYICSGGTSPCLTVFSPAGQQIYHQEFSSPSEMMERPVVTISQNGDIYVRVTTEEENSTTQLICFNKDFIAQWQIESRISSNARPFGNDLMLTPNGTLYIGTCSVDSPNVLHNFLSAIDRTGQVRWSYEAYYGGPMALGPDGTVYFIQPIWQEKQIIGGKLFGIQPDGKKRCEVELAFTSYSKIGQTKPPSVTRNGTLLINAGKEILALSPDGETLWRWQTNGSPIVSPITIGKDQTLYFRDSIGFLIAVGPSQQQIETVFPNGGELVGSGANCVIQWKASGPEEGQFDCFLSFDSGTTWEAIKTSTPTKKEELFSCRWLVPQLEDASRCRIKVRWRSMQALGWQVWAMADQDFTIVKGCTDVSSDFWASQSILGLSEAGIINGYPDSTFKPENPVTRAEFTKMALLSLELKEEKPENPTFPDVPKDHWSYSYIEGAVKAGLIKGYPDGTFKPDGQVTKAEEMAVAVRGKKWETVTPSVFHFSDCQADAWFAPYVESALAQGIVKIPDPNIALMENGTPRFEPNLPATRAQTAVFLARTREK